MLAVGMWLNIFCGTHDGVTPMRVGFGICKDCGDAGRLKYGARRSRVMRSGSNMGPGGQGEGGAQWAWTCRKPTRVAMRVGFGICKDCGDAGRLKYGARRSRVMRAGSNMGPGGQGEGGAQWAWT